MFTGVKGARTTRKEAKLGRAAETIKRPCIVRVVRPSITLSLQSEKEAKSEGVGAGCMKETRQSPGATGASSCWALMGVRSEWLSILRLTAHSSTDRLWY